MIEDPIRLSVYRGEPPHQLWGLCDTLASVTEKIRYQIDLSQSFDAELPDGLSIRSVTGDDLDGVSRLMLDAYMGTIDYEDETLDDAADVVREFLQNASSVLDRSLVVEEGESLVAGVLVSMMGDEPFIDYVMTAPTHKRQGLARTVTTIALRSLASDGRGKVALYITDGNTASENLFRSLGAAPVES